MSQNLNSDQEKKYSGEETTCPFLGILVDQQTRVGVADPRNYCHLVDPPQVVNLAHQRAYCFSSSYKSCKVYINSGRTVLPPKLEEEYTNQANGKRRSAAIKAETKNKNAALASAMAVSAVVEDEDLASTDTLLAGRRQRRELKRAETQPQRRILWWLLPVFVVLVVAALSWGLYGRYTKLSNSQSTLQTQSAMQLATAMGQVQLAANALATTATAMQQEAQARATSQAATLSAGAILLEQGKTVTVEAPTRTTVQSATDTVTAVVPLACNDQNATPVEIVSGPTLSPKLGFSYILGQEEPQPEAVWTIKNTGNCVWNQIYLWSLTDGKIFPPIIRQNNQEITSNTPGEGLSILPGDMLEIVVKFPVNQAMKVNGEWVLMINELSLSAQPHLLLNLDNWVVGISAVPTSTTHPTLSPIQIRPAHPTITPPGSRP